MDDFKRSQFPAFGNWDYSDGLPITQYFETAKQAGLIRYSFGEQDLYNCGGGGGGGGGYDLYTTTTTTVNDDYGFIKKPSITVVPHRKAKRAEKPYTQAKEQKKQGRVYDLTEPHTTKHRAVPSTTTTTANPKAVDEDLYKIPPELLYKPRRKKMLGFLSRCLVPTCAV